MDGRVMSAMWGVLRTEEKEEKEWCKREKTKIK